jgi:biopolymer transport protein ExbD
MKLPSSYVAAGGDVGSAMTPMIDVVFQLLLYFLCTASFQVAEQSLPTPLPQTGVGTAPTKLSPELQELEMLRLVLKQPGERLQIELNGQPCADVATLRSRLTQLAALANLPLIFDVSAEVRLGHVVSAYDTCLAVGIRDIRFQTRAR